VLQVSSGASEVQLNGRPVFGQRMLRVGDVIRSGGLLTMVVARSGRAEGADDTFAPLSREVCAGPVLRRALRLARLAAPSTLPVVLLGETGTGKEGIARLLHTWSGRTGDFLAINCAAIPEALAESELFGFRRGAFTGAHREQPGLLRVACGGTVLLDEVSELPLALQAKLLRVMQEREVHALGDPRPFPLDVRFLAASQIPLDDAIRRGRMRPDFQARLEGLTVTLPPLRQRAEEIPYLFFELWRRHAPDTNVDIDVSLMERLCLRSWPLNVRELETVVRRLQVLHRGAARLGSEHLDEVLPGETLEAIERARPQPEPGPYGAGELRALLVSMERCGGNLTRACAELRISRPRAYRMLRAAGSDRVRSSPASDPGRARYRS
jgi:transcriptional regulator with PAS, ATPase and Fis domain